MNKEERIQQIAYELWEKDGRPHGKAAEHYYRAERIWMAETQQNGDNGGSPASSIAPVMTGTPATPSARRAAPTKKPTKNRHDSALQRS
ncbi:MAG: DUF2934 domain-containing protein [SAR202 cluster bacterium]|nr:DUF2934 domain-containing protein [SAR202 cluster bacterium]